MTHVVKRLEKEGKLKVFFDHLVVEDVPGNIEFRKGHVYYNNKYEALLYHLIVFKNHPYLQIPDWDKIPNNFFISEFHFSKYAPTTDEGRTESTKIIEEVQKNIAAKIKHYATTSAIELTPKEIKSYKQYTGIYKPVVPSDKNDFFLKIEIKKNTLFLVFPDNLDAQMLYYGTNTFYLNTPLVKAEILLNYDNKQQTQQLTFFQIGSKMKLELHKFH